MSSARDRQKRARPAARAGAPRIAPTPADTAAPLFEASDGPSHAAANEPSTTPKVERRIAARAKAAMPPRTATTAAQPVAPQQLASESAPEHEAERDLLGLLADVEAASPVAPATLGAHHPPRATVQGLASGATSTAESTGVLDSALQLLSTDYYFKQWARLGMRGRSEQVDDFGLDPTYEARVQPFLDLLYTRYFRVQIEGAARIPEQGAALLVCNHAGALPWDGVVLKTALRHARPGSTGLRWLTDDYVFHSPFLGASLNRIGAVRACPENAVRLLARGDLLAVFPEGIKGIGKLYCERYRLQRFGRGGHIKLALRMGVPLIPLAIVGSEESYPLMYRLRAFSKTLGLPFIPVTPLFPWLGPLGLLPLPSRWHIAVGAPMTELEGLPSSAADDSVLVNDLNEQLRAKVQALLQEALAARGPAF